MEPEDIVAAVRLTRSGVAHPVGRVRDSISVHGAPRRRSPLGQGRA